jgi:hypothetical protein
VETIMSDATNIKRRTSPKLDDLLARHWMDTQPLTTAVAPPPDPATMSTSARFTESVKQHAPKWVMLPIPPQRRDDAKRHVAALRRRGLSAVMRPHTDDQRAWAVWACASTDSAGSS